MKAIVVPVNFSPTSYNAARYAADLATAVKGQLHLIHVLRMPFTTNEYPMPDGAFEAMRESAVIQIKGLAGELEKRTAGRVPVYTDMEVGGVEYQLNRFCLELEPFLVIMGAAAGPFDRFLTGSATLDALRRLPYPTLVIPEGTQFEQPLRIVLACDPEDISSGMGRTPNFLRELKDLFGARYDVINVTTPSEEGQGQPEFTFEAWRAWLKEIFPELHFVHTSTVAQGIGEYLNDHPADWLIVFPKKHAFYELHRSKARQIVLQSAIPVMSIPE
jgi:nucleotide-binding universal stress UspA family protein